MQREENGATTESKKTLWVMLDDPKHVLRSVDFVLRWDNTFEPVNQFKNRTIGEIQLQWSNKLLFRCRLEDHPDYQAPKAEPLRFTLRKPHKPGLWCKQYNGHHYYEFTDQNLSTAEDAMWCYIGAIPVILPPKKKVVERLWIDYCEPNATKMMCAWFTEGETIQPPGNWKATAETRVVER